MIPEIDDVVSAISAV